MTKDEAANFGLLKMRIRYPSGQESKLEQILDTDLLWAIHYAAMNAPKCLMLESDQLTDTQRVLRDYLTKVKHALH